MQPLIALQQEPLLQLPLLQLLETLYYLTISSS